MSAYKLAFDKALTKSMNSIAHSYAAKIHIKLKTKTVGLPGDQLCQLTNLHLISKESRNSFLIEHKLS